MADTAHTAHTAHTRPGAGGGGPLRLDELDHAVLKVLHRNPRASFAEVAAAVGAHERTVGRRLDRMLATGQVFFTAGLVPEYLGEGITAEVAVRCAPGTMREVAAALAARPEARSVEVATGSLEVFAELHVPGHAELLELVDGAVGRLPGVVDVTSSLLLQLLMTASDWAPYDDEPTEVRRCAMEGRPLPDPPELDDLDRRLSALLRRDARIPTKNLAAELNVGETTARRRLARLLASHVLHLRLHTEPAFLGYPVEARFRLGVPYSRLDPAVRLLAAEPAVRQLAVTSGPTTLLGYSSHRTLRDFHHFAARVFRGLDQVTASDTALLMGDYKRAGIPGPAG
ncbi:Lrp/AsnC family transcriptional regulator [Streptomyces sp. NPDC093224]|uniref:Lrp/AsnC family transcriptional regulator n=1 Tax=Streptomyces sp. NPDC093224 TaxID=3155198 RepID=UPI00342F5A3E